MKGGAKKNKGMDFLGYLRFAWDRMLHPGKNTESRSTSESLKLYYKVMIIPMIAAIIVALIVNFTVGLGPLASSGTLGLLPSGAGIAAAILGPLLAFVVLIPIGIIVDAAILQFFSKFLFKIWRGDFSKTTAAMTFGTFPIVLFYWLESIPVIGYIILAFSIWSIVVEVISLSRQHKISAGRAFLGWVLPMIIVVVVAIVVVSLGMVL